MVDAMIRTASLCLAWTLVAASAHAGETRCWFENGAVVVPAAFGPIAGDFILDLSQAGSQLHATPAQARGYDGGAVHGTLRLAGETLAGFPVAIVDLDARSAAFTTNIAGVLGADAFRGFVIDLDLMPCRLRLSHRAESLRTKRARLKVGDLAGRPAVMAAISDGSASRRGWFLLDTASPGSRIVDAALSRTPPKGTDPNARFPAPARLRAMSLGGWLFEQTPAGLMARDDPVAAGSVGTAVWSRFHMRLDLRYGWLELSPRT